MEKEILRYQELNLCQIFDVIRAGEVARVAVVDGTMPYISPMHYQWQLEGGISIFHFAGAAHGRRFDALCDHPCAAIEIEHSNCTGIDVVIAEGNAELRVSEEEDAAWMVLKAHRITGRRYFMP